MSVSGLEMEFSLPKFSTSPPNNRLTAFQFWNYPQTIKRHDLSQGSARPSAFKKQLLVC